MSITAGGLVAEMQILMVMHDKVSPEPLDDCLFSTALAFPPKSDETTTTTTTKKKKSRF